MQRILNAELRKSPDLASATVHFKSNTGRRAVSRTLKSSDSCPSIESVLSSSPCMDPAPDPKTSDAGVFGFTAAGPSLPLRVHLPESSQVQLRHSLPTIKPSPVSGLRNTASVFSGRAHGAGVPPIKSKPKTGEPVSMVAAKPAPARLSSGASLERRTSSWRTSDTPVATPVRSTNAVGDRAPRSVKCAEKKPEVPPLLLPNIVEGTSNVFSDTPTRDRKGPPAVLISRGSGRSSRKQSEVAKPTEPGRIRLSARFDHKPTPSPPPVRRTSPSCPSRPSPAPLLTPASTRRPPSTASKTSADHADSLARRTSTAPLPGPAKPSITMGRPLAVAPNAHNTRSARSAGSHAKKEQSMKAFPSPDVTTVSSIAMVAPRKTDHVHAVKSASSLKVASRQSAIPGHVKTSAPARNIGTEVVVVHASLPVRKSLRSLRACLVLLGSRVSLVKPPIRVVAVRSAQALKVHVRKSGVLDGFSTCQFELFSKILLPELLEPSEAVGVPCYLPASDPTRSRTRTKSARAQPAPTFASVDIPQPTQMAGVQPLPMKRTTNLPAKRGPLSGSAILTLLRGKDFSEDGLVLWESPRQDAPNRFPDASCADKYDIDVEADADAAILAMLVQSTPRHWRQEPKGIQTTTLFAPFILVIVINDLFTPGTLSLSAGSSHMRSHRIDDRLHNEQDFLDPCVELRPIGSFSDAPDELDMPLVLPVAIPNLSPLLPLDAQLDIPEVGSADRPNGTLPPKSYQTKKGQE
ncbi:hypothetical protein B0H21DRAFT_881261, partial [Amylocystis lapponica]